MKRHMVSITTGSADVEVVRVHETAPLDGWIVLACFKSGWQAWPYVFSKREYAEDRIRDYAGNSTGLPPKWLALSIVHVSGKPRKRGRKGRGK